MEKNPQLYEKLDIIKVKYNIKNVSGIYFLISSKKIVYVGKSNNLFMRAFEGKKNMKFDSFSFVYCSKKCLSYFEGLYIQKFKPKYNKNGFHKNYKKTEKITNTQKMIQITKQKRFTDGLRNTLNPL